MGDPKAPDAPPPREEQEADYWSAMDAVASEPPPPPPPPADKDRAKYWNIEDWHKADGSKKPPDIILEHVHTTEALHSIAEEEKWDAQKKFHMADALERAAHLGQSQAAVEGSEVGAEFGSDIVDPKRGKVERAAEFRAQGKLEEMDAEKKEQEAAAGKPGTEEQQPYDKAIQEAQRETPRSVDVVTDPLNPARGVRIRQEMGISPMIGGKTGGYSVGPGQKDTLHEALAAEPIDSEDTEAQVGPGAGGPPAALLSMKERGAAQEENKAAKARHERADEKEKVRGRETSSEPPRRRRSRGHDRLTAVVRPRRNGR